jgi:hypothetical protein
VNPVGEGSRTAGSTVSMPLFTMSANVPDLESMGRKRTHDDFLEPESKQQSDAMAANVPAKRIEHTAGCAHTNDGKAPPQLQTM